MRVWFHGHVSFESGPVARPRSGGIDVLRFVAAGLVFMWHTSGSGVSVPLLSTAGREGVILFFVISAYVLYRPMADHRPDVRRYAIRRFTRIYPAYAVALFGCAILTGQALTPDYFLFAQRVDLSEPSVLPASWTLQVEVAFYLLLPAFAAALRGRRHRIPILLLSSAYLYIAVALIAPAAIYTGPWQILWFAWVFPLGMAAALVRRPTTWLLPAGIVVLAIGLALAWSQPLDVIVAIAGVLLVLGIRDVHVWRPVAAMGAALSYPFYLWHAAVLTVVPSFVGGLAITLAISTVSWFLLERPAMNFGNALARRAASTDALPVSTR
jgi:peptidoglycan/LPS O-acetylase OafA/YrhL